MAQRSIQGDQELGRKIKHRRNELNLTIEEAASRAGVGTKTWSRYEAGESIRRDKCKGICKALNWRDFPDGKSDAEKKSLIEEYRDHEAWSQFLADNYGPGAAMAFAIGSDILLDYINQDQSDLASMPSGSHIGQLNTSFISGELPPQFLMRQLIIYLCNEEAQAFIEIGAGADELIDNEHLNNSKDWVFDMFDDMDIITFLYSNVYLTEDLPFHFEHWSDQQFYMG